MFVNNKELVIVDPGKHTTKAIRKNLKRVHFRTKMSESINFDTQGNSFDVIFNNKNYLIGEQAEEQSYDVTKTSLLHKIVTYIAITQLVDNNSIIQLTITCPLSIYKNKTNRDKYKSYIFNDGRFDITVNDKTYHYVFDNVLVLPEDYGVVHNYPSLFRGKRVAIVGLGGLNMNFMVVNNFVIEPSTMFTANRGGNELESNVIRELNSRYALNIDRKEAPAILMNKGIRIRGNIDRESVTVINNLIEEYINSVIHEIKRNGHNLDLFDVIFVGGTSSALRHYIEEKLNHAVVVSDAQWAAVEGSLKIGEIKYAEQGRR